MSEGVKGTLWTPRPHLHPESNPSSRRQVVGRQKEKGVRSSSTPPLSTGVRRCSEVTGAVPRGGVDVRSSHGGAREDSTETVGEGGRRGREKSRGERESGRGRGTPEQRPRETQIRREVTFNLNLPGTL